MSANPLHMKMDSSRLGFADDELLDFQYLRTLSYELYDAASVGEVRRVANDIARKGTTRTAYIESWARQGRRNAARAKVAEGDGQRQTARANYLRAYNYIRAAEFFFDRHEKVGFDDIYFESVAEFDHATKFFEKPIEKIEIPFEDKINMPGYFLKPAQDETPRATVILSGGGDGHGEEIYFLGGAPEALARGLNVLLFHGPGQRGLLHRYPEQVMRADAEAPFRAIVDYALSRPDVDHERLALYGLSFGGYLAPRAAAYDQRIKALVANAPILNFQELLCKQAADATNLGETTHALDWPWNAMIDNYMLWNNGASTFSTFIQKAAYYTLEGLESEIVCPTLCLSAEGEGPEAVAQAQEFYKRLRCPRQFCQLSFIDGADAHCGLNNISFTSALVYDWINQVFAR